MKFDCIFLIALFNYVSVAAAASGALLQSLQEDAPRELAKAAAVIVNADFKEQHIPVSVLKIHDGSKQELLSMNNLVSDILWELPMHRIVQVFDVWSLAKSPDRFNRVYNLILVGSNEAFLQFKDLLNSDRFDYAGLFLILWTSEYKPGCLAVFGSIFETFWAEKIPNVNILVEAKGGTVHVYTFFMYHPSGCNRLVLVLWNSMKKGVFIELRDGYPNKFGNLHGCPLYAATYDDPPSVIIKNNSIEGVEGLLLSTIARKMNFRIHAIVSKEGRGTVHSNGTSTGTFRILLSGKANFSLGSMVQTAGNIQAGLGFTVMHLMTRLVVVVPTYEDVSVFKSFLLPLDLPNWNMVLLVFATFIAMRLMVCKFCPRQVQEDLYGHSKMYVLDLINIFLGGVGYFPRGQVARLLVMIFVVYTFVLRSAYQGSLFKFLHQSIFFNSIKSFEELAHKDYDFYVPTMAAKLLDENLAFFNITEITSMTKYYSYLNELRKPGFKGAVVSTDLIVRFLNYREARVLGPLIALHKPLRSTALVFFTQIQSCLLHPFNLNIQAILETGLIHKWRRDYVGSDSVQFKKPRGFQPLTLENFRGLFYLYFIGISISFLAFLGEHYYQGVRLRRFLEPARLTSLD